MTFSPRLFFDACRKGIMGPTLDNDEVSGATAILEAMAGTPLSWCAYALATAWHETNFTLQPIKEMGGPRYFTDRYDVTGSRPKLARDNGNIHPGDGAKYFGRGYVQLTWRSNYRRAGQKLGLPLEDKPDMALDAGIAADIMREGMVDGWFTGKSLKMLPAEATLAQFVEARRIINGKDKAQAIAKYALQYQKALSECQWA
jgi:putative chitinase